MTAEREPADLAHAGGEIDFESDPPPDVEMAGSFTAEELTAMEPVQARFRAEPGDAERVDDQMRENLPAYLEGGRTYRSVHVRWRLGARLIDDPAEGGRHGD